MSFFIKKVFDWIFITEYEYTFIKRRNPAFMAIKFISFIYTNFILLGIHILFYFLEIKSVEPYWFILTYIFVYIIMYIYYFTFNNKENIKIHSNKKDIVFLNFIFILSVFLNFYAYYYLIENIG
ncbi:hypothetical protein CLU83_4587 [Flavobacterium sp. 1]|nr:hypothetical protein CLU83_4587 [Flavobacterium sp. 1]